jgi:CRISPR-associated protein Cas1
MSILYVTEQGASLTRRGNRLQVEKAGKTIQWIHAFRLGQIVLMGNVSVSPGAMAYLLQQGIDTVFMSIHGKYRGRLMSRFGKNIDLRRAQFRKMEDDAVRLVLARAYVAGKIENCRTLLRRHNAENPSPEVTAAVHQLRLAARKVPEAQSTESLMGLEGHGAAAYFGCFGNLIKAEGMAFSGRNRRPPRDPVNVLLSLGYTLLANVIQTQVDVVGLDPYLGCLHGVEYGRPSLVLDLMEEFRPVLVDTVVLTVVNKQIIRVSDFYRPEENEVPAFDFADEDPVKEGYPILLTHVGMKKFITQFENRLNQQVLYLPKGKRLPYRDVCLEQVRLLARFLFDEEPYRPFAIR